MEKITTDISTFENLRKDGYTYVDKTDLLWRLVAGQEGRQFFISRPRRFGKSLMLSTLRSIFEGRRELFRDLKIAKKKYDWTSYPVVSLDMSDAEAESVDQLRENMSNIVDGLVDEFQLEGVRRVSSPGAYLGNFFKALAKKKGLRRRLQGRPPTGDARRHQLPQDEAQHRRAPVRIFFGGLMSPFLTRTADFFARTLST